MAPVELRYPHDRHGDAGQVSNSTNTTTHDEFIRFVDMNSQPNGRLADTSGLTRYFSPQFTSLQMPGAGVSHYEERKRISVVGKFNRSQHESGRGEISNGSSHNLLKADRPKVAICPVTTKLVAKVGSKCFEGRFSTAAIIVVHGRDIQENVIPDTVNGSYASLGKVRELTESKRKHIHQMYRDFIPAERHLPFITITTNF